MPGIKSTRGLLLSLLAIATVATAPSVAAGNSHHASSGGHLRHSTFQPVFCNQGGGEFQQDGSIARFITVHNAHAIHLRKTVDDCVYVGARINLPDHEYPVKNFSCVISGDMGIPHFSIVYLLPGFDIPTLLFVEATMKPIGHGAFLVTCDLSDLDIPAGSALLTCYIQARALPLNMSISHVEVDGVASVPKAVAPIEDCTGTLGCKN
jgi:hypothetical protein